eukprot:11005571-Ditylum_brightwellii.AAC.1
MFFSSKAALSVGNSQSNIDSHIENGKLTKSNEHDASNAVSVSLTDAVDADKILASSTLLNIRAGVNADEKSVRFDDNDVTPAKSKDNSDESDMP